MILVKRFNAITKFVSSLLALVFCCLLVSPAVAMADDLSSVAVEPQEMVSAYIENEDGERKEIEGQLVPSSSIQTFDVSGEKSATYVFSVSPSDLGLTKSQLDGSYSVRAYLTIRYRMMSSDTLVLLTGVSGYWTISDRTVRVTNVSLRYGCDDMFLMGRQSNEIASVSNNFSYDTGYQEYAAVACGVAGANIEVDMQHGTAGSTWSMYIQNNCCENFLSIFNTR